MDIMTVLPMIIYILIIIFLIVGIILGIKTIITMNKVEKIVDNVNEKIESLNPIFNLMDFATDRISSFSDSILEFFTGFVGKLFTKGKKGKEIDNE